MEVGLATGVTPEEFRVYGGDWDNGHELATEAMFLLWKAPGRHDHFCGNAIGRGLTPMGRGFMQAGLP